MKKCKRDQAERQRRKMWRERKLTDKQLDALAAVAYGELTFTVSRFKSINFRQAMLDGINVNSRLRTLRGYKFLRYSKNAKWSVQTDIPPYELTEDGLSYLKKEGLY